MIRAENELDASPAVNDRQTNSSPGIRDAIRLLAAAQKSPNGAPVYSRYVNRPFGRVFAAAAFRLGLTPNFVSIASSLVTFVGILGIALMRPTMTLAVIVATCLIVGYAMDSADGQLARLRGGGTPAGEWLDHMLDAAKLSSLHLAVLIGAFRFWNLHGLAWLLVPIGFTIVQAVLFFGMTLTDQLRRRQPNVTRKPTSPSLMRSLLVVPTDYGLLCVLFLFLSHTTVFFVLYTVIFAGTTGYLLLAAAKWFNELRGLGGEERS